MSHATHSSRRGRGTAVAVAVAVAVSLGLAGSAQATAPASQVGAVSAKKPHDDPTTHRLKKKRSQVGVQLDDAHDEVLSFNKKVAHATQSVMDAQAKLPAARANLTTALAQQAAAQKADAVAQQELDDATQEVLVAEQRLEALQKRMVQLQANVGDFARRAYEMGPYAELEMVLDAKDPSEFTDRLSAIREVAASKNADIQEMSANRADMSYTELRLGALRDVANQKKQVAAQKLTAAQDAAKGAAAAKAIVDGLIAQQQAALHVAQKHRASVKAAYDDLAAQEDRIQSQIAAAARRLESSTGVPTNGKVNAVDSGTQWYFPLPGYAIGSDAGWRMHPILHYVRCHAGADIGAPMGTPIHAVESGTVIMAGWNGGYGNFTVIDHGNGLTSGYGHQSAIFVHDGEHVNRGEVIGRVGTTGLSTGPHLHLEARINGIPYSPKGWFGEGAKIQVCT